MDDLNLITIEGFVSRPPEVRKTNAYNDTLVTFSIANRHGYRGSDGKRKEEVSYFDIEAWGETLAKIITGNAHAGRGLRCTGRLKENNWKDPNGIQHKKIVIITEKIEFKPDEHRGRNADTENIDTDTGQPQPLKIKRRVLKSTPIETNNV